MLDTVLENARSLQRGLGKDDNEKLMNTSRAYRLHSFGQEEKWIGVDRLMLRSPNTLNAGLEGKSEVALMYDLLVAAFQTDSLQSSPIANPLAASFSTASASMSTRNLSHYVTTKGEKLAASQKRDLTNSSLLAGLIDSFRPEEADGSSLFDHIALA